MQSKRTTQFSLVILVVAAALLLPGGGALAQSGEGYDLTWWSVDGGGVTAVGAGLPSPYSLGSTVGQQDAGTLTGGGYTLVGGFWRGGTTLAQHIYLPLVMRNF